MRSSNRLHGCIGTTKLPGAEWDHTDVRTLSALANGMGWAGSSRLLSHITARLPLEVSNSGTTPDFHTLTYMNESEVQPGDLADWLLGQGRYFITTNEAAVVLGVSAAKVPTSLERAREAGKMISVTKGGWVPVPPAYRSAGAPPASHDIDQFMAHLDHPYCVGLLSAAAIHGASHQSPMVLQVVTPARLRERRIGRSRIQFLQ